MRYSLPYCTCRTDPASCWHVHPDDQPQDQPSSDPKRYRMGPWLVSVLTMLIMLAVAAVAALAVIALERSASAPGTTPRPIPHPTTITRGIHV